MKRVAYALGLLLLASTATAQCLEWSALTSGQWTGLTSTQWVDMNGGSGGGVFWSTLINSQWTMLTMAEWLALQDNPPICGVNITITTSPSGRTIAVDSINYTAPHTFTWNTGDSHTIGVASPQGGSGTLYTYASWSDSGGQTHSITVPSSAATYTASFTTSYQLTTFAGVGGSITPSTQYYSSGSVVAVTGIPNAGYTFDIFTGSLTGPTNPQNITMSAPATVTANFTITGTTAAPGFSPSPGTYAPPQTVTITSSTSGASIRYTTDGSIPSETYGTLYTTPVFIGLTTTLNAIAYKAGFIDSTVTSGLYVINGTVPAPTFLPGGGTYGSSVAVLIISSLGSSTIRYTTDGSTPSESNGTIYFSPVLITASVTLKAIAYQTGYVDSSVTSASYSISTVSTAIPITGTFQNPDGTTVTGNVRVTMPRSTVTNSCTTPIQLAGFQSVGVNISGGTLGPLALYPSVCLSAAKPSVGTPVAYVGTAAGTGATASVGCTSPVPCQVSGTITLHTGTNPSAGLPYSFTTGQSNIAASLLAILTMQTVNGNQPSCSLQPSSSNSSLAPIQYQFAIGQTSTAMQLVANGVTALTASTSYTWTYACVQPYLATVTRSDGKLLYTGNWIVPNAGSANVTQLDAK